MEKNDPTYLADELIVLIVFLGKQLSYRDWLFIMFCSEKHMDGMRRFAVCISSWLPVSNHGAGRQRDSRQEMVYMRSMR